MRRAMMTVLVLAAWPAVAVAADTPCTSDKDCAAGEACLVATCPACPPDAGMECPACDATGRCATAGGGVTTTACASDADCPAQFTCDTVEVPCVVADCAPCTCACPMDQPDCKCECPPCEPPPACTPTTTTQCQYHEKQCASDADCPAGFACEAQEVCSGSACACAPCEAGKECPACDCGTPEPPTCEVTGHVCEVVPQTCVADADCAEGFTCVENRVVCGCPACICPVDQPDCGCTPCDCGEPTKQCLPKGWTGVDYGNGATAGTPDTGTTTPVDDTAKGGTGDTSTPPTASPAGTGQESATTASDGGSSGCRAGGQAPAWFLFLLPLIAFLPRAVRRRA